MFQFVSMEDYNKLYQVYLGDYKLYNYVVRFRSNVANGEFILFTS